MMEYRQRLYDVIKSRNGEWVNAEVLSQELKIDRKSLLYTMRCIINHKEFPGLKRKCKRSTEKMTYNSQKAVYDISYKYEV